MDQQAKQQTERLGMRPADDTFDSDRFIECYRGDPVFLEALDGFCANRSVDFLRILQVPTFNGQIPLWLRAADEKPEGMIQGDYATVIDHLTMARGFAVKWGTNTLPPLPERRVLAPYFFDPTRQATLDRIFRETMTERLFVERHEKGHEEKPVVVTVVVLWKYWNDDANALKKLLDEEYEIQRDVVVRDSIAQVIEEYDVVPRYNQPKRELHLQWLYERTAYGVPFGEIADHAPHKRDGTLETEKYVIGRVNKVKGDVGITKLRGQSKPRRWTPEPRWLQYLAKRSQQNR